MYLLFFGYTILIASVPNLDVSTKGKLVYGARSDICKLMKILILYNDNNAKSWRHHTN